METLKHKRVESFEIVLEHDIDEQYQYVPGEMMKGVVVIVCMELIQVSKLVTDESSSRLSSASIFVISRSTNPYMSISLLFSQSVRNTNHPLYNTNYCARSV